MLQPRQCPNGPALTAATGASSPHRSPSPRNAFLSSRAAENSWILPQDAPSECENSSSARSHGNCSLATRPHLLFSSLCSCARPPRAAHQAADGPATGTGLPAHPARPRPSPRPGCRPRCPRSRWLCRPQAPCQALGVPFHTWSRGDATRGDGGSGTARPLCTPGAVPCRGQVGDSAPKGTTAAPWDTPWHEAGTCHTPEASKPPWRSHRGPPAAPGAQHHLCTPGAPAERMATGNGYKARGPPLSALQHPPATLHALLPPPPSPWQQHAARQMTGVNAKVKNLNISKL